VRDGEGAGRVPRGVVHDVPFGAAGGSAVTDPPAVSPHDVGATALALALCRWCSCPYLAVRGRHGQSSLASHEKQCLLNSRGRRRGRDAAAADAAPTLLPGSHGLGGRPDRGRPPTSFPPTPPPGHAGATLFCCVSLPPAHCGRRSGLQGRARCTTCLRRSLARGNPLSPRPWIGSGGSRTGSQPGSD